MSQTTTTRGRRSGPGARAGRALAACALLSGLAACGNERAPARDELGSAALALTVPDGRVIDSVSYRIERGAALVVARDIDVAGDTPVAFEVVLPAAPSYSIALTATTRDGVRCSGSASFAIVARQVTAVALTLRCQDTNDGNSNGRARINATVVPGDPGNCPDVSLLAASHLTRGVGQSIDLAGGASLPGASFAWSSSAPSITPVGPTDAVFTCTAAGDVTITLTVSQAPACVDSESVVVTCVAPAGGGEGGAGGTGEGGAGGTGEGGAGGTAGEGGSGGGAPTYIEYTFGHADIGLEFELVAGELEVHLHAEGATIDGVPNTSGEFHIEDVLIVTQGRWTRPDPDFGFFANTCVAPGVALWWLPQGNGDAAAQGAPFLGLANEAPAGVFSGNQITLSLVGVDSPSGSGHYSMWKDGFPPVFQMTTCNGIDASDAVVLPIGHDHFNMGFTEAGAWQVHYRASGNLVGGGSVATDFSVNFLTR